MKDQNNVLDYLTVFKKNTQNHNIVTLVGFLYLLINILFIAEPNFEAQKKKKLMSKDISSLQRKISIEKNDSIQLKLEKELETKNQSRSSLTHDIKKAKDIQSILIVFAFLNAHWEHASLYSLFLITLFTIYLLVRRLKLLKLISKYLRESANAYGTNENKEFGIDNTLLLAPIPSTGFKYIKRNDVIESLGWKHSHRIMTALVAILLIGLFLIQLRLVFQEYYISPSPLTVHTVIASLLAIITTILSYLWFKGNIIMDSYNTENDTIALLSRRDFLKLLGISGTLLIMPISYKLVEGIREKVDRLIANKPRFKIRKNKSETRELTKIERKASNLIKINRLKEASEYLLVEINRVIFNKEIADKDYQHTFRLIDFLHKILLVRIYRYDSKTAENMKKELEKLVHKIQPENFRLSLWKSDKYKWARVIQEKSNIIKWNKIELI